MKNIAISILLLLFVLTAIPIAADEEKNVTIIKGESTADGTSTVHKELLEECIVALPGTQSLQAQVTSETVYLKTINGDDQKNDFIRTYTAVIEINYMIRQKELIIITTNTLQKQEPVTKVVDKQLREKQLFTSNPSESGDIFAGKSEKKYYFSTSEAAVADAKKRAGIWLAQQTPVICTKK